MDSQEYCLYRLVYKPGDPLCIFVRIYPKRLNPCEVLVAGKMEAVTFLKDQMLEICNKIDKMEGNRKGAHELREECRAAVKTLEKLEKQPEAVISQIDEVMRFLSRVIGEARETLHGFESRFVEFLCLHFELHPMMGPVREFVTANARAEAIECLRIKLNRANNGNIALL